MLARDEAFFKALFFSGDRTSDLSNVKTAEIIRLPGDSSLLCNHIRTETLRNGDANVFAFKRGRNCLVCPVTGIEMNFQIASLLKIDLSRGFLFRMLTKEGKVSSNTLSPTAAQACLREYCS